MPNEVLSSVVGYLRSRDFARAMRVSTRWRAVVLDHRIYWRNHYLFMPSTSKTEMFLTRLSRTRGRPIVIIIHTLSTALSTDVLKAVAQHMHHVEMLHLFVSILYAADVLGVLQQPAPLLRELSLSLDPSQDGQAGSSQMATVLPILPSTFDSPLRKLSMTNIVLHGHPPPCLRSVQRLAVSYWWPHAMALPNVFAWFPELRHLTIGHKTALTDVVYLDRDMWARIDHVQFDAHGPGLELLRDALGRVKHITTQYPDQTCLSIMNDHLDGPLTLTVTHKWEFSFVVHVRSPRTDQTRSFVEFGHCWYDHEDAVDLLTTAPPARPPHALFSTPSLVEHVVLLVIPAAMWNWLVPYFAPMPVLEQVVLMLGMSRRDQPYAIPAEVDGAAVGLTCASLRTLVLKAEKSETHVVPAADLIRFVTSSLCGAQLPVRLHLQGVCIEGPLGGFEEYFTQ